MFSKNEFIIYGDTGVCEVIDICTPSSSNEGKLYYKLLPVFEKCVILVPTDAKVFMRPVITKQQAIELIYKIPSINVSIPKFQSCRQLKEYYRSAFTFHTCDELVLMIKTISTKIDNQCSLGKKPCQTDLKYIKKAKELLYGELSIVLDIPLKEVPGFIENTISEFESKNMCYCG